jgi:hypothetical protein
MTRSGPKAEWELAEQIAQAYYLRTGRKLKTEVFLAEIQRKFNPYHDPDDGRFTFGPGSNGSRSLDHGSYSATASLRPNSGRSRYPVRVELPSYPVRVKMPQSASAATEANRRPTLPSKPLARRFSHSSGIDLPDEVVAKANTLSDAVRTATGHQIHVTSGRRPAHRQAAAMYDNFTRGKGPRYLNQTAFEEVHRAYQAGLRKGLNREQTIVAIEAVLTNQVKRGVYLSRHMRSKAIDIRTPSADVLLVIRRHPAVQSVGVEGDHIHIQFH